MTFNCPRLTWPALARRHAGPWPRKMSATSSDGRDMRRASGGRFEALLELARDAIERTHDLPDDLGGDTRIERRGIELGYRCSVPEDASQSCDEVCAEKPACRSRPFEPRHGRRA